MPLYCYIIIEGEYDYVEHHILGHKNKYSEKEFEDLCLEIMAEHGKVKEEHITVPATLETYDRLVYTIHPQKLIKYLVNDYGFEKLELPYQEGYAIKRLPNPQPQAKYVKYVVNQNKCPFMEGLKQ